MQVMRELLIGRLKMEGSANLFTIVTKCIERAFIKDDELVKDAFQGQILGIFQNIQDRLRVMLDIKDASAAMTSEIEEVDCQLLLWVKMASPKVNELWKEMHAEKRKFKEEQAAKIAAAKEKGKQRAT